MNSQKSRQQKALSKLTIGLSKIFCFDFSTFARREIYLEQSQLIKLTLPEGIPQDLYNDTLI